MKDFDLKLYLVTDRRLTSGRSIIDIVEKAVAGGVTIVQLREKEATSREFFDIASELKKCLQPFNVPLIINDRLDIALAVDADGLHIGNTDMPYDTARRLMGYDKIIGLSVENIDDVIKANDLDVDYIGVSPVFDTETKKDTVTAFGIEGLHQASTVSKHRIVGIGGIKTENAAAVIKAGAEGIAVVSAIVSATDPRKAASELRLLIDYTSPNKVL